jgi:hypothetical protein
MIIYDDIMSMLYHIVTKYRILLNIFLIYFTDSHNLLFFLILFECTITRKTDSCELSICGGLMVSVSGRGLPIRAHISPDLHL